MKQSKLSGFFTKSQNEPAKSKKEPRDEPTKENANDFNGTKSKPRKRLRKLAPQASDKSSDDIDVQMHEGMEIENPVENGHDKKVGIACVATENVDNVMIPVENIGKIVEVAEKQLKIAETIESAFTQQKIISETVINGTGSVKEEEMPETKKENEANTSEESSGENDSDKEKEEAKQEQKNLTGKNAFELMGKSLNPPKSVRSSKSKGALDDEENEEEEGGGKSEQKASYNSALLYLKNPYDPIKDAGWSGDRVPYAAVASCLNDICATTKRLLIVERMTHLIRSVLALAPNELINTIYLCTNQIAPEYEGIELGIGETILLKAIASVTGRTIDQIKKDFLAKGDIGQVAQESRGKQKMMFTPPSLTVEKVYKTFREIAMEKGNASMKKKIDKITSLLVAAKGQEAMFIVRTLHGKMRAGLATQSIYLSIAHSVVLNEYKGRSADELQSRLNTAVEIIKSSFSEVPSYNEVIPILLANKLEDLPKLCTLRPGLPVKPMLASPSKGIQELKDRFKNHDIFTCEFKYDGERAQVHLMANGEIHIYSRNSEDNTSKYPDLIQMLPNAIKPGVKELVLDCEAVPIDLQTGKLKSFQILSTRSKKDVKIEDITVPVCLVVFDILYLNGQSLVKQLSLKERREKMETALSELDKKLKFATYKDVSSYEEVEQFLADSIEGQCEGLMVKTLNSDSFYYPGRRTHTWMKLKKDYMNDMSDSVDLVPIGAYIGKGKRTGVYGGYLLACYDEDSEQYQSICKIGTGFSDEDLKSQFEYFKDKIIEDAPSYYTLPEKDLPDVYFTPSTVWEVRAADLSISPSHKAAMDMVETGKGISLRFPRFLRIRDDKNPEDATTSEQIAEMFKKQSLGGDYQRVEDDEMDY